MAEQQRGTPPESLGVKIALWAGIVFTAAAIVRVGLWRSDTPQPAALSPVVLNRLQTTGWTIQARRPAASTGEELSWAQGVELTNAVQHPGAVLSLVPVQARGPSSFTLETVVRPVLGDKTEQSKLVRFGQQELARFNPGPEASKPFTTEATCLTSGQAVADPGRMVRTKLQQERLITLQQQLERLVGLRQTRKWDCLLVAVRRPAKADGSRLWSEVVPAMLSSAAAPR
jgi:hypothetical protein